MFLSSGWICVPGSVTRSQAEGQVRCSWVLLVTPFRKQPCFQKAMRRPLRCITDLASILPTQLIILGIITLLFAEALPTFLFSPSRRMFKSRRVQERSGCCPGAEWSPRTSPRPQGLVPASQRLQSFFSGGEAAAFQVMTFSSSMSFPANIIILVNLLQFEFHGSSTFYAKITHFPPLQQDDEYGTDGTRYCSREPCN